VNDDLARLGLGLELELDAHPAVTLVRAEVIPCGDSIGKNEEGRLRATLLAQALDEQLELIIEHVLQSRHADIALALAVDRVGKRHVVSRDRLGQCARCAADAEKPTRHFLPGADFGKSAVKPPVEIDLDSFFVRGDGGGVECFHASFRIGLNCSVQAWQISTPSASLMM
jgi:hypothetical protein